MIRSRSFRAAGALGMLLALADPAHSATIRKISLKVDVKEGRAVVTCVSASDGACYVRQGGSAAMPVLRLETGKSVQFGVVPVTALLCYSADPDLAPSCTASDMAVSLERSTSVDKAYFGAAEH
jgi:hypothetical protein